MACYTRAKASARQQQQTLIFCQAADFSEQVGQRHQRDIELYKQMLAAPSLGQTNRLPGIVLLHIGMRVRITTQVRPPWAVQDATGTVMEIDASPQDQQRLSRSRDAHPAAEMCLAQLPHGVYIKLDDCDQEFLPPLVCQAHQVAGFCKQRLRCRAYEGCVLVQPITRPWTFTDRRRGDSECKAFAVATDAC